VASHIDRQRQTDIAKPDDGDPDIIDVHQGHGDFQTNANRSAAGAQGIGVQRISAYP
jgi:hypothetical protein